MPPAAILGPAMPGPSLSRRQFLHSAGGLVAAGGIAAQLDWLEGCGNGAGDPDWAALAGRLRGTLVLPDDAGFTRVSRPLNRRYESVHPTGVALVRTPEDVVASVDWAVENGVPIAVRSGGHNYAGYCDRPRAGDQPRPDEAGAGETPRARSPPSPARVTPMSTAACNRTAWRSRPAAARRWRSEAWCSAAGSASARASSDSPAIR